MALFGERYGDEVRVLSMGEPEEGEKPFSVELCGGTHVNRTGDIGMFKMISEVGIAAGVRRIEALTGLAALAYVTETEGTVLQLSSLTKSTPAELAARIDTLLTERKNLERQVTDLRRQMALIGSNEGGSSSQGPDTMVVGAFKMIVRHLTDIPAKDLKPLVDDLKNQIGSGIVVVTSVMDGKSSLVVGVSEDLTAILNAVDLVRAGAAILGGSGGGGRTDLAQAGGSKANVSEAVEAIVSLLRQQ
jgi:alanyl-tRNA synthetase